MTFQWKSISCRYLQTPMKRFEAGPEKVLVDGVWVPWPRCPDGGALKAYKCSADKWTIAFGVRWHPDNRPVVEGDTITADQVWEYTDAAVARVEEDIRSVVTVDMTPWQYAGVVFWVYNLGIGALKKTVDGESQLLPKINAGRWLDAASAMGVFVYATTTHKDGNTWKRALFGLFIRRCAEGCLLMGCDWEAACDSDRLSLPTRTDWQPALSRYYDVVLEGKTPFLNVYRDAKAYPLEAPELTLTTKADPVAVPAAGKAGQPVSDAQPQTPAAPAPTKPVAPPLSGSGATGPASPPKSPQGQVAAPVPVPPEPRPLPPTPAQQREGVNGSTTPGIDPSSPKSMLLSRRFWGLLMIITGRVVFALFGTDTLLKLGSDPLVSEMVANVMVMLAASAWEYCGEMLHTWGKARARRALR